MASAKKSSKKLVVPAKLVLHKRLDRKTTMASLKPTHERIDNQRRIMRKNKRVSRAVLSREFSW